MAFRRLREMGWLDGRGISEVSGLSSTAAMCGVDGPKGGRLSLASFGPVSAAEDEPWSPTSIGFGLLAAQYAGIGEHSEVCDLGAGEAVSSIAISRRTGAGVWAVDSSGAAVEAMQARAKEYQLGDKFWPVQADALSFLKDAVREGKVYDLVLAEGGLAGVIGHRTLLEHIRPALAVNGMLVLSGYVYNGTVEAESGTDPVSVDVADDVKRHYENTRHANGRREILDEQEVVRLLERCGFKLVFNCRSAQNHWSSYFRRMYAMCRSGSGAARVYGSTERQFGLDEAFHNLRGQMYLSYAMVMATAG